MNLSICTKDNLWKINTKILQSLIEKMEIVTVGSAVSKTKLNRKEIIDFVRSQRSLRIFDEENQKWINENVDGHC